MSLILQDTSGNSWSAVVNATDGSLSLTRVPNVTPTPGGTNSITVTVGNIINAALQEIGALSPGESTPTNEAPWVLQKLQRLIDRYNARRPMVYNVNFATFNTTANHSPHTIGPGADFDVIQRPQDIQSISLLLSTSTNGTVELLLRKQDQDWWAAQTIKDLTSTLPTDFYYSPDWPNGSVYFWPVPTAAYQVRIQSRLVLGQVTSYTQSFSMPPAYWDLMVYDLAISLGPSYERPITPDLRQARNEALKAVLVNNISSPRLTSDAPSQPSTAGSRPGFNFLTGKPW